MRAGLVVWLWVVCAHPVVKWAQSPAKLFLTFLVRSRACKQAFRVAWGILLWSFLRCGVLIEYRARVEEYRRNGRAFRFAKMDSALRSFMYR